jgi:hypothetical protein
MHKVFKVTVCALVCFSMIGCSTMNVVSDWKATSDQGNSQQGKSLQIGDEIVVTLESGSSQRMTFSAIESDALIGYAENSAEQSRLPLNAIVRVEKKQFSSSRTILLVLGIAAGLGLLVSALRAAGSSQIIGAGSGG